MIEYFDVFLIAVVFVLGLIFGSFANVVAYRLHTGQSLNNRSHCLSCGRILSWYELVPLVSYLALLGRCSSCGSWIPLRYLLVEVCTGLAFVGVFFVTEDTVLRILYAIIMVALIVGAVYDFYHSIIPDEVVIVSLVVALMAVGYESYLIGSTMPALYAFAAAGLAFLFFWGLWFFSGGRWIGFGDAKLAIPLALLVGLTGVFSLIVFSFWIGALISVALMSLQAMTSGGQSPLRFGSRRLRMKSEIPFAPFLILGFILVFFFRLDVLAFATYVLI